MIQDTPMLDAVRAVIRDVPDFPKPGIVFKDITPVLSSGPLFRQVIDALVARWKDERIDKVVGIESRGFCFAAPLAYALGAGLTIVRKPGKLPWRKRALSYALEYGTDTLELHEDAVAGERVVIIDDLLATGGTARAAADLVTQLGGTIVGYAFVIELAGLAGRARLADAPVTALLSY